MATLCVLLTGFGPFPGASENPSAWLAETLASQPSPADCEVEARVFPTEWEAVAALAPRLYAMLQPRVMIHFGLSQRASGFRIEHSAHNRSLPRVDARGALPATRAIAAGGPYRLDTAVSTSAIAEHLRGHGFAASASRSCGRYLCNFLYYHSLSWAARQDSPRVVLFVHVPPGPRQGGPFGEDHLLRAAQKILSFVLASTSEERRQSPGSHPLASSIEGEAVAEPCRAEAP